MASGASLAQRTPLVILLKALTASLQEVFVLAEHPGIAERRVSPGQTRPAPEDREAHWSPF